MVEIILPAMGEGIIEAEITRWMVREGMKVVVDQPVAEVATDKVDSEIPAPAEGIIHKILLDEGDTAKVGQVMALIAVPRENGSEPEVQETEKEEEPAGEMNAGWVRETFGDTAPAVKSGPGLSPGTYEKVAFISPVIRKLAVEHGLSPSEIQGIKGSGLEGRITRADVLDYLAGRSPVTGEADARGPEEAEVPGQKPGTPDDQSPPASNAGESIPGKGIPPSPPGFLSQEQIYGSGPSTIQEMDRMRRLIAEHMAYSKQVAPHVTSFVESDVTGMVRWRNRVKDEFLKKYGQKLTITTLILEAVIKSLKEHPGINVSVDGYRIIHKKEINVGMATALPDGNLIVPVIHGADRMNLVGLAGRVNDLADRARANRLKPSETQGGTFTVTNLGQFGNIAGTPIIHQPQVAILAVGSIEKKPAVVETPRGDAIGIRHILILSLAYDHRVVDGALGGTFLKSIGVQLQGFDPGRAI